jgi:hypothetical protein
MKSLKLVFCITILNASFFAQAQENELCTKDIFSDLKLYVSKLDSAYGKEMHKIVYIDFYESNKETSSFSMKMNASFNQDDAQYLKRYDKYFLYSSVLVLVKSDKIPTGFSFPKLFDSRNINIAKYYKRDGYTKLLKKYEFFREENQSGCTRAIILNCSNGDCTDTIYYKGSRHMMNPPKMQLPLLDYNQFMKGFKK